MTTDWWITVQDADDDRLVDYVQDADFAVFNGLR